ncbi:hypothetical protein MRX96_024732 [Rhipicephalus microplus]
MVSLGHWQTLNIKCADPELHALLQEEEADLLSASQSTGATSKFVAGSEINAVVRHARSVVPEAAHLDRLGSQAFRSVGSALSSFESECVCCRSGS